MTCHERLFFTELSLWANSDPGARLPASEAGEGVPHPYTNLLAVHMYMTMHKLSIGASWSFQSPHFLWPNKHLNNVILIFPFSLCVGPRFPSLVYPCHLPNLNRTLFISLASQQSSPNPLLAHSRSLLSIQVSLLNNSIVICRRRSSFPIGLPGGQSCSRAFPSRLLLCTDRIV
ncbi:hypothetical protein BCR34DRAFT_173555 [Clohesyomyces aquaticus]|uniref:Uncharacterized protein n=1 Tax=Clohesyomyces aquaticus TaxID=1231657 RepID=A0A1Y1YHH3_9PLEO|nr:hypothetical protein BCR34DRAFT_173555 [Clohesyomyces aquaticus]